MSYRVALPSSIYCRHQSFVDWDNEISFQGDYNLYLLACQSPEMEYINDVSTDMRLEDFSDLLYDKVVSGSVTDRYRIFDFKSESHFTWFRLRFS